MWIDGPLEPGLALRFTARLWCYDRLMHSCRESGSTALGRYGGHATSRAIFVALLIACASVPAAASPPVELVETIPVESTLGDPTLPAARDAWLALIRDAKHSLDFEQFYLSHWPGEPMGDVLEAIRQAARRGVKVRLLLDARMHRTYPQPADSLGMVPNITVRTIDMGRLGGGVQHSKYFLVDDRVAFLGSQNFDWRSLKHIHELGVRVADRRVVQEFRRVFEQDWKAAVDTSAADAARASRQRGTARLVRPLPFRIVQAAGDTVELWPSYSPKGHIPDSTRWDRDAIVRLLDSARREIVVQLLVYAPVDRGITDEAIDQALRRAGARGVKVKLLISDWEADGSAIGSLQSLSRAANVEARLSTVPEWSGGYIPFGRVEHCKYAVVDSLWTWLGTSNWEPSYFHTSRNIAVTMRNQPIALRARRIFETSWGAPGAAPVKADSTYAPKVHGETPPPGKIKYGG